MTVSELIKRLEKMPQSLRVVVEHREEGYNDVSDVDEILVKPVKSHSCSGDFEFADKSGFGTEKACRIMWFPSCLKQVKIATAEPTK